MRLPTLLSTGLAALSAVALAGQAQAHEPRPHGAMMPPPPPMAGPDYDDHDMPPPPPMAHHGYDGPDGAHGPHGYPGAPMPGPWMAPHCDKPGHGHAMPHGCGYPGYPMMTYAVPMMMVPVLRQKPCPEKIVEEWIEEPVPVRRRYIPRRVVPDKRVRIVPDKRVPMKRIPY